MTTYEINTEDGRVLPDLPMLVAVVEKRNAQYVVNVYHFGKYNHTAHAETTKAQAVFFACSLGKVIALGKGDYRSGAFLGYVSLSCGEPVSCETQNAVRGILSV
jgi:hypothetical protein